MPSTTPGWLKNVPTRVTSTYAVPPENTTSVAAPVGGPGVFGGRPLANVVIAPVSGSTRSTRPAGPSVTYSALSGPTVLPEPQATAQPGAANVASSCTTGGFEGFAALAEGTPAATIATAVPSTVKARLESMVVLPVVCDGAALAPPSKEPRRTYRLPGNPLFAHPG